MFDVLFTFFSTFWFYLWHYKRSERRKSPLSKNISTFWFYLWRHKRSECRKSIFGVLFGFRRSDFRSSDYSPNLFTNCDDEIAMSLIFPHPMTSISWTFGGSHPWTLRESWDPENRQLPSGWKVMHLKKIENPLLPSSMGDLILRIMTLPKNLVKPITNMIFSPYLSKKLK